MELGDKIKSLREIRQMSTTDLAKATDLSQSYISALENKTRIDPTKSTIEKISKALRVPPAYFWDDDIVTPFDVLPEMPREVQQFMLDLDNMPYLQLSRLAKEEGITPEMLEGLLKTLIDAVNRKR